MYLFNPLLIALFTVCKSIWIFPRSPSLANKALENPRSSRPSLELPSLGHQALVLGMYSLSSHVLMVNSSLLSCPTECRLSRSQSPWKCTVSLRFTNNSQGQVRNEIFGPVIYDKGQVEERIRRAQKAILNPSKPCRQFLVDNEDIQDSELTFSSNCVSLQISGPDVADLSFCDLPGAFLSQLFPGFHPNPFYKASLPTSVTKEAAMISVSLRIW